MKAPWVELAQRGRAKMPNGGLTTNKPVKRIRPISYKLEVQRKIYRQRARDFLARNPRCAVMSFHGEGIPATQVHHSRGKLGSLLLDERWWIPTSAMGHSWIDANRDEARKLMWNGIPVLAAKGDWWKGD